MNHDPKQTYTFRLSPDERQMLADIAKHVVRTDAEALRVMIHGAHKALKERDRLASAGAVSQPAESGK